MIDAELWLKAEDETKFHRSQIQGFLYDCSGENGKAGVHCVRDCLRRENQVLWKQEGTEEEYDALHEEAGRQIRLAEINIIAERYQKLKSEEANAA